DGLRHREFAPNSERRNRQNSMPDLDGHLVEAEGQLANHRGSGYAVRLQAEPTTKSRWASTPKLPVAVGGYPEGLRRCKLLALTELPGRFLRWHGFYPSFGLPPRAITSLYANSGPNVQPNEVAFHLP